MTAQFKVPGGIFTVRPLPTLITLVMLGVLLGLGVWQVERLHWKENLLATIHARMNQAPVDVESVKLPDADYRPASATGVFSYEHEIYIHAISLTGEGGWHVLSPFRLKDGRWLLVDRGFVPFEKARTKDFSRLYGNVTIKGILRAPAHRWPQPDNDPVKNDWYWPDLRAVATAMNVPEFMPVYLDIDATTNLGGYPVGGQTRLDIPNNHFVYALTWFGLAFALLVVYGVSSYRKVS